MVKELYLDNAASTKVYKSVVNEMERFFLQDYGNPGSRHRFGEEALSVISGARKKLAGKIGAKLHEMIFTSGATESNNLAIQGVFEACYTKKKNKIIISSIEHPSVREVCIFLKGKGCNVVEIPVNKNGVLDLKKLEEEIDSRTILVSVMQVNNIFGTIQPIEKIGKICKKKNVIFHTDAVQSFGKIKIDVNSLGVDLLSASAHKIGGPKGVGFLYIREGSKLNPIFYGGGQEGGLRSGTQNVPGIVGFAKAMEIYSKIDQIKVLEIRDYFIHELEKIGAKLHGDRINRVCNNIHVSFSGFRGEDLVYRLSNEGIYVSVGSACDSKRKKEDDVLKAISLSKGEINGSLRITINEFIRKKDVDRVIKVLKKIIV